tara:strand:+ start:9251 stop:9682 length:432 start_codon:yes stop_codon:yes gene_type:complete
MESLLKRGKKFYKDNETAINVGMLLIPGVGLLGQGVKHGIKYALSAQRATDTFKAVNKLPKIKYVKQPKGTSGSWLTQNRLNTQRSFLKERDVYKVKYKQYRKEQADLAHTSMKKMMKYTGTGLALSGAGIYQAGKKNRNNSR